MTLSRKQIWERVIKLGLSAVGREPIEQLQNEESICKEIYKQDMIWKIRVVRFDELKYKYDISIKILTLRAGTYSYFSACMHNDLSIRVSKTTPCSMNNPLRDILEIMPYEEPPENWVMMRA